MVQISLSLHTFINISIDAYSAEFVAKRMNNEQKEPEPGSNGFDCIRIIQIPLKQHGHNSGSHNPMPLPPPYNGYGSKNNHKSLSSLSPICICGSELKKYQLQYAYMNGSNLNTGQINCDECNMKITKKTAIVWHCVREKVESIHKYGYDLCEKCGEKKLLFNEFDGLKKGFLIERDERYPIRMTLQYYKCMDDGMKINDEIMSDIKQLLTITNDDGEDEKEQVLINVGYTKIYEALKKLGGKDWKQCYDKCLNEEVNDNDILNLTEEDLKELFPKIGPRSRIRKWISIRQENEQPIDYVKAVLGE